jgi:hypothetical protein
MNAQYNVLEMGHKVLLTLHNSNSFLTCYRWGVNTRIINDDVMAAEDMYKISEKAALL